MTGKWEHRRAAGAVNQRGYRSDVPISMLILRQEKVCHRAWIIACHTKAYGNKKRKRQYQKATWYKEVTEEKAFMGCHNLNALKSWGQQVTSFQALWQIFKQSTGLLQNSLFHSLKVGLIIFCLFMTNFEVRIKDCCIINLVRAFPICPCPLGLLWQQIFGGPCFINSFESDSL